MTAMISQLFLQHYWWIIVSILASLLVFLMFVQGGQSVIYSLPESGIQKSMIVNSLGRIHDACHIWRRFFRIIPIILCNEFWWCLLGMDSYLIQFYHTGCSI